MLSLCVYVTHSLPLVSMKVIANIQSYIFHKENNVLLKNKYQGIIPTTMLASLVFSNSFVSEV